MKVYVLIEDGYEFSKIIAVFDSEENAAAAMHSSMENTHIEEFEVIKDKMKNRYLIRAVDKEIISIEKCFHWVNENVINGDEIIKTVEADSIIEAVQQFFNRSY